MQCAAVIVMPSKGDLSHSAAVHENNYFDHAVQKLDGDVPRESLERLTQLKNLILNI
jgi:hypothetical protein